MSSPNQPRRVTVAATQMACDWDIDGNIARAERLARKAADQGAQVILLQELFETPYFCIEQDSKHFALATRAEDNRAIRHFRPIARELGAVIPISFFERAVSGNHWSQQMPSPIRPCRVSQTLKPVSPGLKYCFS